MKKGLQNVEKLLKRNLKNKVSLSLSSIVCFLITGTFAFGETIVINQNSVETSMQEITSTTTSITNDGIVDVKFIGPVISNQQRAGNGINSSESVDLLKINNSGTISGDATFDENSDGSFSGFGQSGNGINFTFGAPQKTLDGEPIPENNVKIGELNNLGILKGFVKTQNQSFSNGNGIAIRSTSLQIESIKNIGMISGESKLTSVEILPPARMGLNIYNYDTGNGIFISNNVLPEGSVPTTIENAGVIKGDSLTESTVSLDDPEYGFDYTISTGNGVSTDNLNISRITNTGLISGKVESESENGGYKFNSGNGMQISGRSLNIESIENSGAIKGESIVKYLTLEDQKGDLFYSFGNGLLVGPGQGPGLRVLDESSRNVKAIENSGIISGKNSTNSNYSNGRLVGNGIVGNGGVVVDEITNEGVISGYSTEMNRNDYELRAPGPFSPNGNGIILENNSTTITTIENFGVIKGNSQGIYG
ncbi:MAG: hypothetical protein ACRCZO_11760, partial [Cetobacterium sp.]